MSDLYGLVNSAPTRVSIWVLGLIYIAFSRVVSECDPQMFMSICPSDDAYIGMLLGLSAFLLVPWLLVVAFIQGLCARWRPYGHAAQAIIVLVYSAPVFFMVFVLNMYEGEGDYLHVWSIPLAAALAWTCYMWIESIAAMLIADLVRSRRKLLPDDADTTDGPLLEPPP